MKKFIFISVFLSLAIILTAITKDEFITLNRDLEKQAARFFGSENHKHYKSGRATTDYQVGDTKVFWKWDLSVMPPTWVQTPSTCRAVGEHCYLFVADEDWQIHMNEADVQVVMNYLEEETMNTTQYGAIEMDIEHFGEIPDELDNDPKLIVFYSALGSFGGSVFDGYFSVYNQVTEEEAQNLNPPGHSNECEMIYMTCYPLDPTDPVRISVLSHELQHLIHWGKDENEDTWLNEGMSELAMVYFGMPDPITQFPNNPNNSLNEWNQTFADYVKTMLFFTYLEEHYDNGNLIKDIVADTQNSIQSIRNQLENHQIQKSFEEIFTDWTIANYLDNPNIEDSLYYYESLSLPTFSIQATHSIYPAEREGNINKWAAKYVKFFPGASDLQLHFNTNHNIDISFIALTTNTENSVVIKYEITDSLTVNLPHLGDEFQYAIMVITNNNENTLNYSYSVYETGTHSEQNELAYPVFIAYPNPVNIKNHALKFNIKNNSFQIYIYNIKGEKIANLINSTVWNGVNLQGENVHSGVYFYKIISSKNQKIGKVMLVR